MTRREGAVPYQRMAVVRFGVEEETGMSGCERVSPQGNNAVGDGGEDQRQRGSRDWRGFAHKEMAMMEREA
ncbi:hypothetical protein MRB53_010945 [Persea americana]|uniref:Uncharacterized protein n=1 Tax=Persea americana TaxID=3435 RepID=A0ACC2LU05_PERAE|nr:hypothetical protein MRB53_010945 [Persea americana]